MRRLLLYLAFCVAPCFGSLTTVTDVLNRADGTPCLGFLEVQWGTFTNASGTVIQAGSVSVAVTETGFAVALEPGQYSVSYYLTTSGCASAVETWVVPTTQQTNLSGVRSLNPPSAPAALSPTVISSGGAFPGACLVWSGTSWGPASCPTGGTQGPAGPAGEKGATGATGATGAAGAQGPAGGSVTWRGAWSSGTTYTIDDGIFYLNSSYVSLVSNNVNLPPNLNPSQWQLIAAGSLINYSDAELPSGTIDGSNVSFTLAHTPNPAASLILTSGMVLRQGSDYTISGATITFTIGAQPKVGETVQAWYRY